MSDNGQTNAIVRKVMRHNPPEYTDSRILNTRMVLFQAFTGLVLSRPYDEIHITDIIEKAGVSRSTFYQHYRNKNDILASSMGAMFSVLADAATGKGDEDQLLTVLTHFWDNRNLGRIIFNGPALRSLSRELSSVLESRLGTGSAAPVSAGTRFKAIQLAEGQLAAIRAWLCGTVPCTATELALHLLGGDIAD